MRRVKFGFTLIELLVVIGIIALLATVGMASYRSANMRSRDARRQADLEQVRAALEMYRTDEGTYPTEANFGAMVGVLGTNYLATTPSDPLAGHLGYEYMPIGSGTGYEMGADLENSSTPHDCSSSFKLVKGISYNYCVTNP